MFLPVNTRFVSRFNITIASDILGETLGVRTKIEEHLRRRDSDGLIRHSALLMAGAQIVNVCNLAFQLIAMRMLGNADYSVLGVMLSVFGFCCISLGALSRGVTHFTALLKEKEEMVAIRPFLKMVVVDALVVGIFLLAVFYLFRSNVCGFFKLHSFAPFGFMLGSVFVFTFYCVGNGMLQGLQRFKRSTLSGIFQGVSRLGFLFLGLLGGLLVVDALSAHMFSYILGFCVCTWFVFQEIGRFPTVWQGGDARVSRREFYGYCVLYLTAWVSFSLLMNLDLIMAKHYFDADTAGVFSKVVMLGRMVIFIPLPVASALFPKVATDGKPRVSSRRTLVKGFVLVCAIVFSVAIGASLFSSLILRVMNVPDGNGLLFISIVWALVPLAFVYLLLSYELAQRRFAVVIPVCVIAIGYFVLLQLFRAGAMQYVLNIAIASVCCFVVVAGVVWRGFNQSDSRGRDGK